jgi:hypothetical protein
MKTLALYNPKVAAVLSANPTLAKAYMARYGTYDWEVEPMHRASWRAEQAQKEEQKLASLLDKSEITVEVLSI